MAQVEKFEAMQEGKAMKDLLCQALESPRVRAAIVEELNRLIDLPFVPESLEAQLIDILVRILVAQAKQALGCAED